MPATPTPINSQNGGGLLGIATLTSVAIRNADQLTDDRRKLLICGTPESVAVLRREGRRLWLDPPACFKGEAWIVGSFAGVPVAQDACLLQGGLALMLGDKLVGAVTGWAKNEHGP